MENYEIFDEIQSILAILDADELPEVHGYLASVIGEEEICENPYEIANKLLICDQPEPLPQIIIDFIAKLFETAFENGNADAINDLGAQYYNGNRGFEQNYTKAVEYYNIAAEHGSRIAQENLGYCYYYGRNMAVDYEKAYHYFALGALAGMPISLYKLGDMYQNGNYVEKNEQEAFSIYEHCLDLLNDESAVFVAGPLYLRLGNAFLYGRGTQKNPKNALVCFQKAEMFLFDMVESGDTMYKGSLNAAIEGQAKAREKLYEA